MYSIKNVLMQRDGMSAVEADKALSDARELFASSMEEDYFDPDEFLAGELGLKPDYIFDMI